MPTEIILAILTAAFSAISVLYIDNRKHTKRLEKDNLELKVDYKGCMDKQIELLEEIKEKVNQ